MKEFKIGNTVGIIHSPFLDLPKEARKEWFETEMEKGNPILKEIERAVNRCYEE